MRARARGAASGRQGGDAGYTLVGLMIAVAVVNIALAAAVTSMVTVDRRAREAELLWRGQQIARALDCYAQTEASQGRPEKLEQLVEASCLRRAYADPLGRDGKWRLLTEQDVADGTVAALLGQPPPTAAEGGSPAGGTPRSLLAGRSFRLELAPGGLLSAASGNRGIVGVTSSKIGPSLRLYNGRQRYEEWVFLAGGGAGSGR